MPKHLAPLIALVMIFDGAVAQKKSYRQPRTVGIHFVFNDFVTASAIRGSSLSYVLREHQFGKMKDMHPGLGMSYGVGVSEKFDFSSTFSGAFLPYPFETGAMQKSNFLLLEADASLRGKMFTDKHWFVPYLLIGVGVSKYKGYWGTFIPTGMGVQVSFFGEAYLLINSQYRIAVTETTTNHFVHSIGLAGKISR